MFDAAPGGNLTHMIWRTLTYSPARRALVAVLGSTVGRQTIRSLVRTIGRKRVLLLAWRAVRL